ncbi:MAG: hypothetical protein CL609_16065 [Anaerolineaceae bacterium]|nr:hypothetical protein [Anaerolineaceae bacterium]
MAQLEFSSSVTFFVGENGCGKSTLMRLFFQKNLIYGIILKIREKTEYYFKKRI